LLSSDLGRGLVTMSFDDPSLVIDSPELLEGDPQFLHRRKCPHPEEILLENTYKSFGASVPLGFPHEGGGGGDPQEPHLFLEDIRQVLTPMVMTEGKPCSNTFPEGAEAFPHPLADRLQGLETGPTLGGMNPHAFHRAVVHRKKDGCLPFRCRNGARHVGTPHLIHPPSSDLPVMGLGAMGVALRWEARS